MGNPVKLPPHFMAILATRLHEKCHLCGGNIHDSYQTNYEGVLKNTPLLCIDCHDLICGKQSQYHLNLDEFNTNHASQVLTVFSGGLYTPPLKRIIAKYKDEGDVSALMVLYHLLVFMPKPEVKRDLVLIPTPTTQGRLRERGFQPVVNLTKFLSYLWQIPIWHGLARQENHLHQRGLGRQDRLQNVVHDFYLNQSLESRHVILVDDVLTTGATMASMAHTILRKYPKTNISALSILRAKN